MKPNTGHELLQSNSPCITFNIQCQDLWKKVALAVTVNLSCIQQRTVIMPLKCWPAI